MQKSAPQPRSRKTPTGGRMMARMILQMSLAVKGILVCGLVVLREGGLCVVWVSFGDEDWCECLLMDGREIAGRVKSADGEQRIKYKSDAEQSSATTDLELLPQR